MTPIPCSYYNPVEDKICAALPNMPTLVCLNIAEYAAPNLQIEEMVCNPGDEPTTITTVKKLEGIREIITSKTWKRRIKGDLGVSYTAIRLNVYSILCNAINRGKESLNTRVVTATGGRNPSTLQGIMVYKPDPKNPKILELTHLLSAPWNVEKNDNDENRCRGVGMELTKHLVLRARLNGINSIVLASLGTSVEFYEKQGFTKDPKTSKGKFIRMTLSVE